MALDNSEKLQFILKTSEELGITAYEFGKNTDISSVGTHDILTGKSKNPRTRNLNAMLAYIETKYNKSLGTDIIQLEDPFIDAVEKPATNEIEEAIYDAVHKRLQPVLEEQASEIYALREDLKNLYNQYWVMRNNQTQKSNGEKKDIG